MVVGSVSAEVTTTSAEGASDIRSTMAPPLVAVHQEMGAIKGARVVAIRCRKASSWAEPECLREYGLVLLRRGGFWRRVRGRVAYADSTTAYFERPGVEQQIGHEGGAGDECTVIVFSESAMVDLAGDVVLTDDLIPTTPSIDLGQRTLIARLDEGVDPFELEERLTKLVGGVAERAVPGRLTTSRPQTDSAHRRIVDHARQAIAADPAGVELAELANGLGHSRFHVSRVFSRMTGMTLTQHRNHVRVTAALDRLAAGESNLANLAVDLGFADQSHMIRVVRRATGDSPSVLRRWLSQHGRSGPKAIHAPRPVNRSSSTPISR